MKLTLSLLLTLSTFAVQAQPQSPRDLARETGQGNIFNSNRNGGFFPGLQSEEIDYKEATREAFKENNRYSVQPDATRVTPRPCTPIPAGTQNVVLNPCRPGEGGSDDSWGLVAGPTCNVTFTEIKDLSFGPPEENLHGILLKGQHNAPAGTGNTGFEVLDLDGFLVLAALHSAWQSNRLLVGSVVSLPLDDIRSARRVVDMGLNFFRFLMNTVRAANDPNIVAIEAEVNSKTAFLRNLATKLQIWESRGGSNIPKSEVHEFMSAGLERFAPGAQNPLISQYRDLPISDRPQVFCHPQAESLMVGRVLCSRNFVTNTQRSANFCAGGINFNRLSSLPVCSVSGGVEGVCRPSLYAQSTSGSSSLQAAPAGSAAGSR